MQTEMSQATSAADEIRLNELHSKMTNAREAEYAALREFERARADMQTAEGKYHIAKEARMDADAAFHRANGRQQRLSSKLNRGRR